MPPSAHDVEIALLMEQIKALLREVSLALKEVAAGQAAQATALQVQTGQLTALTTETRVMEERVSGCQNARDQKIAAASTASAARWARINDAASVWIGHSTVRIVFYAIAVALICRILGLDVPTALHVADRARGIGREMVLEAGVPHAGSDDDNTP